MSAEETTLFARIRTHLQEEQQLPVLQCLTSPSLPPFLSIPTSPRGGEREEGRGRRLTAVGGREEGVAVGVRRSLCRRSSGGGEIVFSNEILYIYDFNREPSSHRQQININLLAFSLSAFKSSRSFREYLH